MLSHALATTSAPARRPPETPSVDAQTAAQARALQARYVALAAQPDALARALTGKPLSQLSPQQQARVRALAHDLRGGKMAWPDWRQADRAAGATAAGAGDALFNGAVAAFVPGQGGSPGTALLGRGLDAATRDAAIAEELGEAIAHAAVQRGIEVGGGDGGARLAAALGGQREFAAAEFQPVPGDSTSVRLNGKTTQAAAKSGPEMAKQPLKVKIEGTDSPKGFALVLPVMDKPGKTTRINDDWRYDEDRQQGAMSVKLPLGYDGTIAVLGEGNKKVGELIVKDYGTSSQKIDLRDSKTHRLRRGRDAIVVTALAKAAPPLAKVPLRLAFPGHANFELHFPFPNGTKYVAVDNRRGDASGTPGLLQMPVNLGYSGYVGVMSGGKRVATLIIRNYGKHGQEIKLRANPGYRASRTADGTLKLEQPGQAAKPVSFGRSMTPVSVQVDNGGYVLVTTPPKGRFAVVSGMNAGNRAKYQAIIQNLSRQGIQVRDDLSNEPGVVQFTVPYKQAGDVQVRYPNDSKKPEADIGFANAGTSDFKVVRTERFKGRGVGRRAETVASLISGNTIIAGGKSDNDVVAGRLAKNVMAAQLTGFAASLRPIKITTGGNSAEQFKELEDGVLAATKIIAGVSDTVGAIVNDFVEVASKGMTFSDLLPYLVANTAKTTTEDEAMKLVGEKISQPMETIKAWLRDNAANIRGVIANYKNTKSAEQGSRMDKLLATLDMVAGLASGIGTFGSAAASVASLMVRVRSKGERLPILNNKQEILDAKTRDRDQHPEGSPERERAQGEVDKATRDRDQAASQYQAAESLAAIGKAQLASWAIAVPGAAITAGSRTEKFIGAQDDPKKLTDFVNELKKTDAEVAKRNAKFVERVPTTDNGIKQAFETLNLPQTAEWKDFGHALRDGLSAIAEEKGWGKYLTTVDLEDDGTYTTKDKMAKRYRERFDQWVGQQPPAGMVYYPKGKAKYDDDIGAYNGKVDIYKVDAPVMKWFEN